MSEYQQTEIGRIPREWKVMKVGKVVKDILTGATPLRSNKEYWLKGNIPWLTNEEVEDEKINYIWETKEKVTEKALKETNIKLIPKNSVILSLTASVGKVAINKIPITTNQQFNSFIIDFNKIHPEFLGYYFIFAKKRIEMLAGTTTFRFISKSKIANFKIPLPPLPEQQKIAEILSTVDKAIEKVDSAIAKTERLKKGLMQKLLTKGIGHKEFKDTKIGRIPKEWEVVTAEKICDKVTDGTHDTPKPAEKGCFLITSKHIKNGRINFSDSYFITKKDFDEINKRSKVDNYDVLFSMIGTVGETAIVRENYPEFAIKNVGLFKTKNNKTLALWLHSYFKSKFSQDYIRNNLKGTTQKYIPLFALRKFPIVIPPLSEQQKIAEILSTVDKRLELLRNKKEKLERIKKGLMNDLLTGRKRVKV